MVSYHYIRGVQPFAIAGRITFIYMKYFYYEIRLIKEYITAKCEPTQNTFKHKLRIDSITLCDITNQIVTHRVD